MEEASNINMFYFSNFTLYILKNRTSISSYFTLTIQLFVLKLLLFEIPFAYISMKYSF